MIEKRLDESADAHEVRAYEKVVEAAREMLLDYEQSVDALGERGKTNAQVKMEQALLDLDRLLGR